MVDDTKVKYICDIYDWDGKGEIDLFFLGDVMYALGLNITKKVCVGLGQTDEEGKKFAKFDDVVEKVKAAVATPDSQVTNQNIHSISAILLLCIKLCFCMCLLQNFTHKNHKVFS